MVEILGQKNQYYPTSTVIWPSSERLVLASLETPIVEGRYASMRLSPCETQIRGRRHRNLSFRSSLRLQELGN